MLKNLFRSVSKTSTTSFSNPNNWKPLVYSACKGFSTSNAETKAAEPKKELNFKSFEEFYPYYLSEHKNLVNKRLHFIGTTGYFGLMLYGIVTLQPQYFLYMWLSGYSFAWVGHFYYEKNRPATFKFPFWSMRGDWTMYFQMLTGKISLFK